MKFTVKEVISGDKFIVSPLWEWQAHEGDIVEANGYFAPRISEPGYEEARKKLEGLILLKEVELTNPIKITNGRLLCDVFWGGRNPANFFPEY